MTDHPVELADFLTDDVPETQCRAARFAAAVGGEILAALKRGVGDVGTKFYRHGPPDHPDAGGLAYPSHPDVVYLKLGTSARGTVDDVLHELDHVSLFGWADEARIEGNETLATQLEAGGPAAERRAAAFAAAWGPAVYQAGVKAGWNPEAVTVRSRDLPRGALHWLDVSGTKFLPGDHHDMPRASWHVIRREQPMRFYATYGG